MLLLMLLLHMLLGLVLQDALVLEPLPSASPLPPLASYGDCARRFRNLSRRSFSIWLAILCEIPCRRQGCCWRLFACGNI
jgi:hypothetical protein